MRAAAAAAACAALAALALTATVANAQDMQMVRPGMTETEVVDVFGSPDGKSAREVFTYYFYNNGCEAECGFPDLVIFQTGQVVDAVLRAPWRSYAGMSSSPKGTAPKPTPMQLGMPQTEVQGVEVRSAPQPPTPMPAELQPADTTASDSTSNGG